MSYAQQKFNKEWITLEQYIEIRKFLSKEIILEKIIPHLDDKEDQIKVGSYVRDMVEICHLFMNKDNFKLREFLHLLEALDFLELFYGLVRVNPILDENAMQLLRTNIDVTRDISNKQIELMKTKFEETLSDSEKFKNDFKRAYGIK